MEIADLVAYSADEYVSLAVGIASDHGRRDKLSEQIIKAADEHLFNKRAGQYSLEAWFLSVLNERLNST